jgi:hypothetical protein
LKKATDKCSKDLRNDEKDEKYKNLIEAEKQQQEFEKQNHKNAKRTGKEQREVEDEHLASGDNLIPNGLQTMKNIFPEELNSDYFNSLPKQQKDFDLQKQVFDIAISVSRKSSFWIFFFFFK